jgi:excinuclease ABC subunit A
MVDAVLALPEDTKLMILAPVAREKKGEFTELFAQMQALGYMRFRVDGQIYEHENLPALKKTEKHDIDVVIDRVKVRADLQQRLAESIRGRPARARPTRPRRQWPRAGAGDGHGPEHLFSSKFACPVCSYSLAELEPRLFSFNSPMGACPACDGMGQREVFDPARVVAFPTLSLASGAIKGWDRRNGYYFAMLESLARHYGSTSSAVRVAARAGAARHAARLGRGRDRLQLHHGQRRLQGQKVVKKHPFEGILPNMARRYRETDSVVVREDLARYRSTQPCPECHGTRLRREARHVKLGEGEQARAIYEVSHATLAMRTPGSTPAAHRRQGRDRRQGGARDRHAPAVSERRGPELPEPGPQRRDALGGEAQRIRLASQIGSGLTGVMYVLDEPSIGLHQRDNDRLIATLQAPARHRQQRDRGRARRRHDARRRPCDRHGPRRGRARRARDGAGHVTTRCAPMPQSLTGQYLSGTRSIAVPKRRTPWLPVLEQAAPVVEAKGQVALSANRSQQAPRRAHGRAPRAPGRRAGAARGGRHGQQPEGRDGGLPRGPADLRDGRVGLGQEHAGQRHAVRRRGAPALPRARRTGRRTKRSWASSTSTRSSTWTRAPLAARRAATRPPTPACSRPIRELMAETNTAKERGYGPGASASTWRNRRRLRGLPGRRRGEGGDALSARRVRALRHLPRPALQPRDAGSAVEGQEHRADPGADGGGRGGLLQGRAHHRAQAADAAGRGPVYIRLGQAPPRSRAARRSA